MSRGVARRSRKIAIMSQECREMSHEYVEVRRARGVSAVAQDRYHNVRVHKVKSHVDLDQRCDITTLDPTGLGGSPSRLRILVWGGLWARAGVTVGDGRRRVRDTFTQFADHRSRCWVNATSPYIWPIRPHPALLALLYRG